MSALDRVQDVALRAALCGMRAMDVVTRLIGPALVLLALGLISLMTYTFFETLHPFTGSVAWFIVTGAALTILCNLVFNHVKCAVTAPVRVAARRPRALMRSDRLECWLVRALVATSHMPRWPRHS
jgi:hypothetical protein